MSQQAKPFYTPEEYLALEATAENKSEYFHRQIYQMAGGSFNHNRIALNLANNLNSALAGSCEAFALDTRLLVKENGLFTYPDVMVICGAIELAPNRTDTATNPIVIFEVLSDSTAEYDRTDKFDLYKDLNTLQNYILVDQHRAYIQCFQRAENNPRIWWVESYRGPDSVLNIPALNLELELKQVYNRVEWPAQDLTHPTN